jgi:ATP-dependent helicase/DNAse subunit B
MPATLLTAPAGYGKTRYLITQIVALKQQHPLARVWVLLPTDLQINAFRDRLNEAQTPIFGIEYFNFYKLYARLLDIAGIPQRSLQNGARFRILREVIAGLPLEHFDKIRETPGFISILESFIDELKQAHVEPETFTQHADSPKDRDLAAIYGAYQDYLRRNTLADSEGQGWLSLATLKNHPELNLNAELLIIDGYDQFDLVQAELIATLSRHIPRTILALTYQDSRAETAHRRFAQTHERLLNTGDWQPEPLPGQPPARESAILEYLSTYIFESRVTPIAVDDSLKLIEAPDRRTETAAVLRSVKRRLLDGASPESILIVARDLDVYVPYFLEIAAAYGIPIVTRRGLPLPEHPTVAAVIALLNLAENDFPRRDTLDVLRSPYIPVPELSMTQIDLLDQISQQQIVLRGRGVWLEAIALAAQARRFDEEGESEDGALLTEESAAALVKGLDTFFERVTPPSQGTARQFVNWLEALIAPDSADHERVDDLGEEADSPDKKPSILGTIRALPDDGFRGRDLIAMDGLQRVINAVLAAYDLVDPARTVAWKMFSSDLLAAVESERPITALNRLGKVLLVSVYEARCLAHAHVYVVGLSEGEFPHPVPEDPLYTDLERAARSQIPLRTRAQDADESSLFYEMTAIARRSLTLSRPYIDDKGNEWPPSPYWRGVGAVIQTTPTRLKIGEEAGLTDAARLSEVMVAAANLLNGEMNATARGVHAWLLVNHAGAWENALRGRRIESRRLSARAPHDAHSGMLTDRDMIAWAADKLGPNRLWSASQFNEYGTCPYRFFARRLLKLEEFKEPEEGLDVLQFGSLVHDILENTYRQIGTERLAIRPDNQARALEILDAQLKSRLVGAPGRYKFRKTRLWEQEQYEIRTRLERLIRADFSDDSPIAKAIARLAKNEDSESPLIRLQGQDRYTFAQELAFSGTDSLILDGPAGPVKAQGKIDRVDVIGSAAIVLDYKTGAHRFSVGDMVEGRNLQMMLYLFAADKLLSVAEDMTPAAGMFWHIGQRSTSGEVSAAAPEIGEAREHLHERILEGRAGNFASQPSSRAESSARCVAHCEFVQLCRVNRASRRKPIA